MSRLRRTALLVACCTPAGLLAGCGQSDQPARLSPPPVVRPIKTVVPPISEPRLLAVPQDVRPVAGDWLDNSADAALRHSDRHQQGTSTEPYTPNRITTPASPAPITEPKPITVVRPQLSLPRESLPAQAGPYSVEQRPIAPVQQNVAPQAPPPFAGISVAPAQSVPPPFQPFAAAPAQRPVMGPVMGPARNRSGFQPVSERIMGLNYQAIRLANRGALYAAKQDLLQALRMATQSLDAADGTVGYSQALEQGLTALNEAEDFALHGAEATQPLAVDQIIAGHRTPVLREQAGQQISPVVAMQQYYGFAGQRLSAAAGELPAAADSLFWLGKVHNALARQSVHADRLQGPRAMVCFRAALAAAPQHYLAANELGVLFARYGELHEAKKLLQQSVAGRAHAEGWQNLAIVHQRLGETQLADLAQQEYSTLAAKSAPRQGAPVTWVDTKTFAASAGPQPTWETPAKPAAGPVATQPNPGARR